MNLLEQQNQVQQELSDSKTTILNQVQTIHNLKSNLADHQLKNLQLLSKIQELQLSNISLQEQQQQQKLSMDKDQLQSNKDLELKILQLELRNKELELKLNSKIQEIELLDGFMKERDEEIKDLLVRLDVLKEQIISTGDNHELPSLLSVVEQVRGYVSERFKFRDEI
jgi:chromosome segregation ATPase